MKLSSLSDEKWCNLIENRWSSSDTIADIIDKAYTHNIGYYKNEPEWLKTLPKRQPKVRDNRIFPNVEAVINSLIANPPKPVVLPGRETEQAKKLAADQERYFSTRYTELNVKETLRKGLRNLYLARIIVIKPYWDASINDFNAISVDPRKVRVGKNSTKEDNSEFSIEEVTDSLSSVMKRFPHKADTLMKEAGFESEEDVIVADPEITYKEAWVRDMLVCKYNNVILSKGRNPYWDWDGLLMTKEEYDGVKEKEGPERRQVMLEAKMSQSDRKITARGEAEQGQKGSYEAYYFNHFDTPRKPYIFATAFNNENSPVGQTDMIHQAAPLQDSIDERKRDITRNARFVNGWMKIDSRVMTKEDAAKLDTEVSGKIWGSDVVNGVQRETGEPLPAFVFQDLQDSRSEIDNIMAASSAFRGEREGQETKAGRLALIEQSFLRLNEFVQITDYVTYELFNWFYQLAKVRYTEHHYAKAVGHQRAKQIMSIVQDDFEEGAEIRVIGGKTLPEDRQFKFEMAQQDFAAGKIAPVDYFEVAGYENPTQVAKNAELYKLNPVTAVGITMEELKNALPPQAEEPVETVTPPGMPPEIAPVVPQPIPPGG